MNRATPTLAWPAPTAITYGTALGSAQLDAAASWTVGGALGSVSGTYSYTPGPGTVLKASATAQSLSVTFLPADSTDYTTATQTTTIQVNRAAPTINWPAPAPISAGTALSGTQLDAGASWTVGGTSGSVAGTFAYTPKAGTVLAAGNQTLAATFTPTDTTDYTTSTGTTTLAVVGPVSLTTSTMTASSSSVSTGGTTTVTLTAKDAFGNQELKGGLTVKFALSGTAGGKITAVADNNNGTYTATYTAGTKVGSETISATIGGKAVTSKATLAVVTPSGGLLNSKMTATQSQGASPSSASPALRSESTSSRAIDAALRTLLLDDSSTTGKHRPLLDS